MISNRSEAWISWHGVLAGAQLVQPRLSDEIAQRKDRLMGPIARICPLPGRPAEVMLRAPIDRSTKEGGTSHAKAALCVRLDWIKEAQAAVRQLLEVQPWHTIARHQRALARALGPEIAAMFADDPRQAGLPEE